MRQSLHVQIEGPDHPAVQKQFDKYPVRIGRDPSSEIALESERVSRCHAVIDCSNGEWVLEDAQSTNGTLVNDELAEYDVLRSGDVISIGPFRIVVSMEYRLETATARTECATTQPSVDVLASDDSEYATLKVWHQVGEPT
jgi:pSer/pThr/pTyr-binding forkhead associated (FHA) protein